MPSERNVLCIGRLNKIKKGKKYGNYKLVKRKNRCR